MKKIILFSFVAFLLISCEKCYDCTITLTSGVTQTEETCGKGKTFKADVDDLAKLGWSCKEQN